MRRLSTVLCVLTVLILSVCLGSGRCHAASPVRPESEADARAVNARLFNAKAVEVERTERQRRLHAAIKAFDAWISASAESRDGWREYLKWDEWATPLVVATTSPPEAIEAMRRIAKRFYAAQLGLDDPRVVELRDAVAAYLDHEEAVRAAEGDLAGEYRRRIDELHRASAAKPVDFTALESAAWWLTAMGQAPDELAAIQARFHGAAIVGQIDRAAVEAKLDAFEHSSQEQRKTRNQIQGATVVGTATVQSHTTPELFDAPGAARLRVVSRGTVNAPHNVATSGRVRVATSSTSQFTATAEVYWDGRRFLATTPQVAVDMHSNVTSIDAPRHIRRAAARRVAGSRASGEAQGEAIIRESVAESMSEQLTASTAKLNARFAHFFEFLARTGNTAELWSTRVRPTSVQIGYMPPSPSGLGAEPHDPPPLAGDETLGLSFHDAALEGILRPQVAGAVWTDVAFARMQRELTGGNHEEFMIGLDPTRWSVQWNWRAPVQIHFSPECVTVVFRFSRVEIDGDEYETPFEVRAELDVSATPQGVGYRTRAPATVAAFDRRNPPPPHFQSFLERKFRGMFTEHFYLDSMQFPAGGALDPLSGYRPCGVVLEPNWVHLRYTNLKTQIPPASLDATANLAP